MKISIIIPVYNSSKTLEKCLRSIYDYNKKGYEVIVVDDGSTDNSSGIAKKFGCRVFRQKKSGQSKARNLGARKAKYDILFFVDSDIILTPNALKEMKKSFKDKNNNIVCGIYSKKSANRGVWPSITAIFLHQIYTSKEIKNLKIFGSECAAMRKKIFFELGGFNERLNKNAVENEEFGYRICRKYRIVYNKKVQFLHHYPNFLISVRKNFHRTYHWVRLFSHYKNFETLRSPKNGLVAIIGFVGLVFLIIYSFFQFPFLIFLSLLSFGIFIINFSEFYRKVYKEKSVIFAIIAIFGSYILSITAVIASLVAVCSIILNNWKK